MSTTRTASASLPPSRGGELGRGGDLVALRTTIATDQNIVTLRFSVTTLLGLVEERIQKLAGLDPLATPAFVTERVEVIRSQLGQIGVEVMRSTGRDVLDGIDRLDAQILASKW